MHLLASWFNRGFLVLRRIDWQTPAAILEKIIAYEAVHEIQGWDDLRRRLDPADRRCFAFFHPSLIDEPLIFVEVALMRRHPRQHPIAAARGAQERRRRARQADDRRVLLDLQLPGRAARHLVRQFPDQAGGRGPGEGAGQSADLRDALAGAAALPSWLERRRWPRTSADLLTPANASACGVLDDPAGSTPMAAEGREPATHAARRAVLPQRQERRGPSRRSRGPLPPGQRRPAGAHQLARGYLGERTCARPTDSCATTATS